MIKVWVAYLIFMKIYETARYPQTETAPSSCLKLLSTELHNILEQLLLILNADASPTVSYNHNKMPID